MRKKLKQIFGFDVDDSTNNGVYPTVEELLALKSQTKYIKSFNWKKFTTQNAGEIKSAFKGRGMELEEIRQYSNGDDVRDIDWRVSARKNLPYTKLYAEEKDREIYVLLDLSKTMFFGTKGEFKSVSAAKVASLIGWITIENKDKFGCVIFDGHKNHFFKPQSSIAQMMVVINKISQIAEDVFKGSKESVLSFDKSLQMMQQNIKNKASIFIISDFYSFDDDLSKKIAILAKKNRVFIVNVFDILEEIPPVSNEYMMQYEHKQLIFNSSGKDFQLEYEKYFLSKKDRIKSFCRKFICGYVEVRTDIPVLQQIKV